MPSIINTPSVETQLAHEQEKNRRRISELEAENDALKRELAGEMEKY
jgi:hypothetical protein